MFDEPVSFIHSLNTRTAYLDDAPEYFGAVDYVGNHCVISGFRPENIGTSGEYAVVVYDVGDGAMFDVEDIDESIIAAFTSDVVAETKACHYLAVGLYRDLMKL